MGCSGVYFRTSFSKNSGFRGQVSGVSPSAYPRSSQFDRKRDFGNKVSYECFAPPFPEP